MTSRRSEAAPPAWEQSAGLVRFKNRPPPFLLCILPFLLCGTGRAEDKEIIQVLKPAPAKVNCQIGPEFTYRSEGEIGRPSEKLCRIESSESSILSVVDQTGKAVEKARKLACQCGADALLVVHNSSDETPPTYRAFTYSGFTKIRGKRKSEDVIAYGIRFIEPLKPRPIPLKDGFRDLTWGQPVPGTFTPQPAFMPSLKSFVRPSDSMKVGPVEALRIEYWFLDGAKLAFVRLYFAVEDKDSLRSFLVKTWGPPEMVKEDGFAWARPGEATSASLEKVVKEPLTLMIWSKELLAESLRRLKEKAASDAGL